MAYQQGDTITATDYNNFAANVNAVIGTGSGDKGYGLSDVSNVSVGATISAAQWNALLSGLQKAANHQGTTLTNASNSVSTGGNILPLSNLAADITLIDTNRLNVDASNLATAQAGVTSTRTTAWTSKYSIFSQLTSVLATRLDTFLTQVELLICRFQDQAVRLLTKTHHGLT